MKTPREAMLTSLNDWTKAMDTKNRADVVNLDFSRGFAKNVEYVRVFNEHQGPASEDCFRPTCTSS